MTPARPPARRTHRRVLATVSAAALGLAVLAPAAQGVSLRSWKGRVTGIVDGDTAKIDIAGDRRKARAVRNAGIQALEIGECGWKPARDRLKKLISGRTIRLRAQHAASSSQGRPVRFMEVRRADGTYLDVQKDLLSRGLVMYLNNFAGERSRERAYEKTSQTAAAQGRGIFATTQCGTGPQQSARLQVWANYDADGDDTANVNGEYVRVLNAGSGTVDLTGWWLRDATHDPFFRLPAGTSLAAGEYLTVHVGRGTASGRDLYWGRSRQTFVNVTSAAQAGDGVYLFDPDGDLRFWDMYPCMTDCTDSRSGHLTVSTQYDAPGSDAENYARGEFVTVRSTGTDATLDLTGLVLATHGRSHEITPGTTLAPGESLVVYAGAGQDARLTQFWGATGQILVNGGQHVVLRTARGTTLACDAWGTDTTC